MAEFTPWPKTLRLYRQITVTEKIDGTNAGIHVVPVAPEEAAYSHAYGPSGFPEDLCVAHGFVVQVTAQSRNRLITPEQDNAGFAKWVRANQQAIAETLGAGLHMGEWWGSGIQRGYGLPQGERRFSLFNCDKWGGLAVELGGVRVGPVPVIYRGMFSDKEIKGALADLAVNGSWAAPGFMDPEGVCVWHSQTRSVFKVTLDNNDCSKWESGFDV